MPRASRSPRRKSPPSTSRATTSIRNGTTPSHQGSPQINKALIDAYVLRIRRQAPDPVEIEFARRPPSFAAARNGRPELLVEGKGPVRQFGRLQGPRQRRYRRSRIVQRIAELRAQVPLDAGRRDRLVLGQGP